MRSPKRWSKRPHDEHRARMIPPGETIGILGGGQLGRMIAMAAAQLGYRTHVYAPERAAPPPKSAPRSPAPRGTTARRWRRFAADCAVITYEFENVPVGPVAVLAPVPVLPHPRALETAQDRLAEKLRVRALGGTTAPFAQVDSDADLAAAIAASARPASSRPGATGYDGKGQWRINFAGRCRGAHGSADGR
jgi:5-(carboxyamino)imidazole ribonucleotide synthase